MNPSYTSPITINKSIVNRNNISIQGLKKFQLPLLLTLLHIPLGLLLYNSTLLGLIHPSIVFFLGLYYAIRKNERLEKVAFVVAYLIGAEVLWRMAKAPIFWEFGKYGAAAIMITALLTRGYKKIPTSPLFYLLFLIPSCLLTLTLNSLGDAKDNISYNMSGPFSLFISCWFFSYLKINTDQLKKILFMVAVPLTSVAVTTLFYTVTSENIKFTDESNAATSGGFGPNQVSSMLGLGVFVCLSVYLIFKNDFKETIYLCLFALFFAAQSVLTFSRGGMYNAVGAIFCVIILQLSNPSQSLKKLLPIMGIGIIFIGLVFPFLNNFTGGSLQDRFEDTDSTGRADIVEADIQIFKDNPLFGVGVGQNKELHEKMLGEAYGSHTEFARLISEHGVFGIFAFIFLAFGTFTSFINQKTLLGKSLAVGAVIWSSLFMMNAGMRMAAPSFMWGLSFLTILTPQLNRKNKSNGLLPKLREV